jgi:hypothetical protein
MVQETVNLIISRLNTLTDHEREKVFSALLNRYCVGCGKSGDWSETTCDCEPGEATQPAESPQLWLTYKSPLCKAA